MNPWKIAQDFEDFAKVAKFCQIWSHCVSWSYLELSLGRPNYIQIIVQVIISTWSKITLSNRAGN